MSSVSVLPDNFISVMIDFVGDLSITFPEFQTSWAKYNADTSTEVWMDLYEHCMKVYPERFFDILYQNGEIFQSSNDSNTEFLPGVNFKHLYMCEGVSETTQKTIWKYLQLILFMVIGSVKDKDEFKNTADLFAGIDESELQAKLTEAMGGIGDFFKTMEDNMKDGTGENGGENGAGDNEGDGEGAGENKPAGTEGRNHREFFEKMFGESADASGNGMPNPEDLHSHLKGLFGGKLGSLAKELVDELTEDLQEALGLNPEEFNEQSSTKDVFAKLMKNPQKFMQIVQKINAKFQDKIKKGDLSQEDIMKEAGEMMEKMKAMGGNSKQMNEMFKNMMKSMGGNMPGGMPGGGNMKNMRMDTNAMDRMMKMQSTKDRLRARVEKKRMEEQAKNYVIEETATGEKVYRPFGAEKQERSTIRPEMTDAEVDALVAEIEGVGEPNVPVPAKTGGGAKKKKKGKGKK